MITIENHLILLKARMMESKFGSPADHQLKELVTALGYDYAEICKKAADYRKGEYP